MADFDIKKLDSEIQYFADKVSFDYEGKGQALANDVLALARTLRGALAALATRIEKLESQTGGSSGPGSLGRSGD